MDRMISTAFRIDKKTYKELKSIAENEKRNVSTLIRLVLEQYIEIYKENTETTKPYNPFENHKDTKELLKD